MHEYKSVSLQNWFNISLTILSSINYSAVWTKAVWALVSWDCSFLKVSITSWWSFCCQELHTWDNHHRSGLLLSSWLCLLKVPILHHDMIWGILWWPPSSLPFQIYWSLIACWCLYTRSQISSGWPGGALHPHALPLSPNLRCIFTYDGIGNQLASGSLELS